MITAAETRAVTFNATDRCDRCSARAQVMVRLHAGGELIFCRHHARKFQTALEPIASLTEQSNED